MSEEPLSDFMDIDQICAEFAKRLNVVISRGSIYGYIKTKGFPANTGIGFPRQWRRKDVTEWIDKVAAQ